MRPLTFCATKQPRHDATMHCPQTWSTRREIGYTVVTVLRRNGSMSALPPAPESTKQASGHGQPALPARDLPAPSNAGRRTGQILIGIAMGGVMLAFGATILAWSLLGNAQQTIDGSLGLTGDAVDAGTETVAIIGDALRSIQAGLTATASATNELDGILAEVSALSEQAATLVGSDIPDGLDDARSSLPELANSLASITSVLGTLSLVGITVDVDAGSTGACPQRSTRGTHRASS